MSATRHPEQRYGTVEVLHVGETDQHLQRAAIGVDYGMAFAPCDPLAGIVVVRATSIAGFTLWLSIMAAEGIGLRPVRTLSI